MTNATSTAEDPLLRLETALHHQPVTGPQNLVEALRDVTRCLLDAPVAIESNRIGIIMETLSSSYGVLLQSPEVVMEYATLLLYAHVYLHDRVPNALAKFDAVVRVYGTDLLLDDAVQRRFHDTLYVAVGFALVHGVRPAAVAEAFLSCYYYLTDDNSTVGQLTTHVQHIADLFTYVREKLLESGRHQRLRELGDALALDVTVTSDVHPSFATAIALCALRPDAVHVVLAWAERVHNQQSLVTGLVLCNTAIPTAYIVDAIHREPGISRSIAMPLLATFLAHIERGDATEQCVGAVAAASHKLVALISNVADVNLITMLLAHLRRYAERKRDIWYFENARQLSAELSIQLRILTSFLTMLALGLIANNVPSIPTSDNLVDMLSTFAAVDFYTRHHPFAQLHYVIDDLGKTILIRDDGQLMFNQCLMVDLRSSDVLAVSFWMRLLRDHRGTFLTMVMQSVMSMTHVLDTVEEVLRNRTWLAESKVDDGHGVDKDCRSFMIALCQHVIQPVEQPFTLLEYARRSEEARGTMVPTTSLLVDRVARWAQTESDERLVLAYVGLLAYISGSIVECDQPALSTACQGAILDTINRYVGLHEISRATDVVHTVLLQGYRKSAGDLLRSFPCTLDALATVEQRLLDVEPLLPPNHRTAVAFWLIEARREHVEHQVQSRL